MNALCCKSGVSNFIKYSSSSYCTTVYSKAQSDKKNKAKLNRVPYTLYCSMFNVAEIIARHCTIALLRHLMPSHALDSSFLGTMLYVIFLREYHILCAVAKVVRTCNVLHLLFTAGCRLLCLVQDARPHDTRYTSTRVSWCLQCPASKEHCE